MTARSRNFVLFVATLIVATPSLMTLFDVGPMGYHGGTALIVRVFSVFLASSSLAMVFAIAGYLYWLRVIHPGQLATARRIASATNIRHISSARRLRTHP